MSEETASAATRAVREAPAASLTGAEDAHTIAKRVREILDRRACPDHWMTVAYEAVVSTITARQDQLESITPAELWAAIDGNPGIKPTKEESLAAAKACAEAADEDGQTSSVVVPARLAELSAKASPDWALAARGPRIAPGVVLGDAVHEYARGSGQSQIASFNVVRVDMDDERDPGAVQAANTEFAVGCVNFVRKLIAGAAASQSQEPAPARKPMVVVRLDGGLVQDVIANVPVDVMVADYDVEGMEADRLAELPKLPHLYDDEANDVPVACEVRAPFVDAEFAESLIRTACSDSAGDSNDENAGPKLSTFTVFVQQADGRGTVHIADYQAATSEEAANEALDQVSQDWGSEDEPWDKDNLHVLGIAKGNFEIIEWNDLDA